MTEPTPPTPTVRLDDLIDAVTAVHPDELQQLSGAVLAADRLGELADHLVGHFVDRARRSGASWSEIGRSMGVSKQAAQQRFTPRSGADRGVDPSQGFERLTTRARNVIVAAHDVAVARSNVEVTPAHLVLGLLSEPDALAGVALQAQGIPFEAVRAAAMAARQRSARRCVTDTATSEPSTSCSPSSSTRTVRGRSTGPASTRPPPR